MLHRDAVLPGTLDLLIRLMHSSAADIKRCICDALAQLERG